MATDYSKKTNADLVEILKSRSLPHTGKKADLVARLQEDDAKNAGTTAAPAPAAKADVADDVIDWEDDEPTEGAAAATAPKASTEAGAATIEAGGKGQASNPAAVPNQKLDENPAATSDLKVEATGETAQAGGAEAAPAEGAGGDDQTAEKSDAAYAKGLPITEMEEELKKRKARAEKFGVTEESQAAITNAEKQLDRAKRFGTGVAPEVGVKKLDEALPQEKSRKRGQNDNDAGGRGGKRRHFGGRNRSRQQGGNRNRRDGGNNGNSSGRSNGQQTVVTEQERAAMEARAKRFAAA